MNFKVGDKVRLLKRQTNSYWWDSIPHNNSIDDFIYCCDNNIIVTITRIKVDLSRNVYQTNKTKDLTVYESEMELMKKNFPDDVEGGNI